MTQPMLTLTEYAERMAPYWERQRIKMLGELAPNLFGLALRHAAECYLWRTFWL